MKHLITALSFISIFFAATAVNAQTINTVAGNGTLGYNGDNIAATGAQLGLPDGVAVDAHGNIFVADTYNNRIRKISLNGVITTIAGTGGSGYSGDGGQATLADIYEPEAVAVDAHGNIFIADFGNQVVRKVATNGIITTIAGTHIGGYKGDGDSATLAELNGPYDIAIDSVGNIFIADWRNNVIRKVNKRGIISTVAGTGAIGYNGDNIQAKLAQLNSPYGIAVDKTGNIFIGDSGNDRVRKVAPNGIITTFAGIGTGGSSGDGGTATSAQLNNPIGITIDRAGSIYIADFNNSKIRKVAANGIITTVAGTGVAGYNGDGVNATSAQLNLPMRLSLDTAGNIFIADRQNNRIRKITYQATAPPTIASFSPASGGTNDAISITGTNFTGANAVSFGGVAAKSFTVNSSTRITARVGTGATGTVSVTTPVGTATLDGFTFCATPSIKIAANIHTAFCAGTPVTFTATPTNGGSNPVYQWQKNGVNVGADSTIYIDSALQTGDTVRCTLTTDTIPCVTTNRVSSNALTFTVNPNLTPSVSITANPGVAVCINTEIHFTATSANGGANPVYQWQKNGINVGGAGTSYTDSFPATGDSVTIMLTSNATCLAVSTVTSNALKIRVDVPTPVINITDNKNTALCGKTTVTFKATVTPSFLWTKNGVQVGDNSSTYKDSTLKTNDSVQCFLVSSATACNNVTSNIINSNKLKFTVSPVPVIPSVISGPARVTAGQSGYTYSVTAVDGIMNIWTLPEGAVITSGQGTNTIVVTWGSMAGPVSVIATNSCGTSVPRNKNVTVNPSLIAPSAESSSVKKTGITDNNIHLSPNPAGAWTNISFTTGVQDKYVITIADAQNKVLEVKNGISIKGTNTVRINTGRYAKGVYFITVTNKENGRKNKELVIGQ